MEYRVLYAPPVAFSLQADGMRCAAGCALASALLAAHAVLLLLIVPSWITSTLYMAGIAVGMYSLLLLPALKCCAASIIRTHLVHNDWVYIHALLYQQMAHVFCSFIILALRPPNTPAALIYIMISSTIICKHYLKFWVAGHTLWKAYYTRVQATVFQRSTIASMQAFVYGSIVPLPTVKHATLYNIYRAVQTLVHEHAAITPSVEDTEQLYTAFCAKLQQPPLSGSKGLRVQHRHLKQQHQQPQQKEQHQQQQDCITAQELLRVFPRQTVQGVLDMFGATDEQQITFVQWKCTLQAVAQHRTVLLRSLNDYACMVSTLENVIGAALYTVLAVAVLWVLGIDLVQKQMGFISLLILFSYAYGSTLQRMFEGCVLVLVQHPYDNGDRILVGTEGPFTVKRIHILTTQLQSCSDGSVVLMTNFNIQRSTVFNLSRAPGPAAILMQFKIPSTTTLDRETVATEVQNAAREASAAVSSTSLHYSSVRSDGCSSVYTVHIHMHSLDDNNEVFKAKQAVWHVLQQQLLDVPCTVP